MKKYILVIIALLFLDYILYNYLVHQIDTRKPFDYNPSTNSFIYQKRNIELHDLNDFVFEDYFNIISFNVPSYKYEFDNEYLNIVISDKNYQYKYHIIEPITIEKVVYVQEKEDSKSLIDNTYKNEENEEKYIDDFMYVDKDLFVYELDTDLDQIRNDLMTNIHSSHQTCIDYSSLNPSYIGQYSVFYISDDKKIEIIVEIS